jgi:hypothetical protein
MSLPHSHSILKSLTKLIFGEDEYRVNYFHAVPLEPRMCRRCVRHLETASHVLLQCSAHLLTCDLRGELFNELRSRCAINIPADTTVDFADFYLKIIIFHWDAVPLTACCVYRVHESELWCGKGTRYRLVAYQHGGIPLESCELIDASGSEYNSETEDELGRDYEQYL